MIRGAKIFIKNSKTEKFLFLLRDNKNSIPHPNQWSLVGGKVEDGESPIEGLKREIIEEVGVDVVDIKKIYEGDTEIFFRSGKKLLVRSNLFVGKTDAKSEDINLTEGQKAEYFELDEILKQNLVEYYVKSINKFRKLLENF